MPAPAAATGRGWRTAPAEGSPATARRWLLGDRGLRLPGPHGQEAHSRRAGLQGTVGRARWNLENRARGTVATTDVDLAFENVDQLGLAVAVRRHDDVGVILTQVDV